LGIRRAYPISVRRLNGTKLLGAVLLTLIASIVSAANEPLEIKGDRVGETVAQFRVHNPNAKCENQSASVVDCSQKSGVSLAGLPTWGQTCDPPTTTYWTEVCNAMGVAATFSDNHLSRLSYIFYVGAGTDINGAEMHTWTTCDVFAKKYGKPDTGDSHHACSWVVKDKDGELEQALVVSSMHLRLEGQDAVFTSVLLSQALSRDI
jgi:hypothetical protein